MQKNILGKTIKKALPKRKRVYTDKDYAAITNWIEKKVKDMKFKTLDEFKDFIRKDFVKGKGEIFINSPHGEKLADKFLEKKIKVKSYKNKKGIEKKEYERLKGKKWSDEENKIIIDNINTPSKIIMGELKKAGFDRNIVMTSSARKRLRRAFDDMIATDMPEAARVEMEEKGIATS